MKIYIACNPDGKMVINHAFYTEEQVGDWFLIHLETPKKVFETYEIKELEL